MKRRKFILTTTTAALSAPILVNGMQIGILPNSGVLKLFNPINDRVLVLIQLQGGNDGLNMVIPTDQYDNLAKARENIVIPENAILDLNGATGLHPVMSGVKGLYDAGKITIVHSAGYPNQNRSHFRSTDIWTTGSSSEEFLRSGWLGRYFDQRFPGYPDGYPNSAFNSPIAITMGSLVSETCQGTGANFSMALTDPYSFSSLNSGAGGDTPDTPYGHELDFLRQAIAQTNAYGHVITGAAKHGKNMVSYPNTSLARQLKNVALLLAGGLNSKVFICNLGGFDTHANQVTTDNPETGNHANLLTTLSQAIAAFQEDLKQLGIEERVLGMTFSEFGRQIRSNFSNGTDHGDAAPLILFGSCVNAGFIGTNPIIPVDVPVQAGVNMQTDFRDIYGSILIDWFEAELNDVKTLLYKDFQHLPILQVCTPAKSIATRSSDPEIHFSIAPNPIIETTRVEFELEDSQRVRLAVMDVQGKVSLQVLDRVLEKGFHRIPVDLTNGRSGQYFFRLMIGDVQKTQAVIKL